MNTTLKYLAAALVAAAAVTVILYSNMGTSEPEQSPSPTATVSTSSGPRACTLEAKLCPDGSYVGRVGPSCEFAPCPAPTLTPTPRY